MKGFSPSLVVALYCHTRDNTLRNLHACNEIFRWQEFQGAPIRWTALALAQRLAAAFSVPGQSPVPVPLHIHHLMGYSNEPWLYMTAVQHPSWNANAPQFLNTLQNYWRPHANLMAVFDGHDLQPSPGLVMSVELAKARLVVTPL